MSTRADRRLDLIVFGATSFVGQLLCRRLVERQGIDGPLKWAIAGRDAAKLERVAAETGADVERIVADASDPEALADMAQATKVVVSTVGPYALHGSALVAAVVAAGTDYCDLTGETQWMRRMIDAHAATAATTGARIVHTCGFDSVPSDLGVWFLQQQALERFGAPCEHVSMRVAKMKGGASGGTIASMMNLMEEVAADPALRKVLADPYALAPPDLRTGPRQRDINMPEHDDVAGQWIGPFVMAAVNTRVVHRTHALLGRPWGPGFTYDEAMLMGTGPLGAAKAGGLTAGTGAGMGLAAFGPTRRALERFVLPKPGEGPTPEAQAKGAFDLHFFGSTADGRTIRTRVIGDRDPGYSGTARMLAEAAVALVDLDADEVGGGFWTPATAFGDHLVERLEAHAGIKFNVVS
ncbi:MAG: saccharopine dehydrogenase NADP-binding domain-containing protein [Aquihabitans sp.]